MRRMLLLGALTLMGCSAPERAQLGDEISLHDAVDRDPRPDVVQVNLTSAPASIEIAPGQVRTFSTYSQTLPGPLIRARRGDTLRVHYQNQLDEPSTIHWHGVRVPNSMDGVPEVSQPLVPPGGSFDYEFTLPDAGLFWYHPHHDSANALGRGLYGAVLVADPDEPANLGDEVVLVLSDADEAPADAPDPMQILVGREGDIVLVNGRVYPTLRAESGRRQRLRLLNASRSRYFVLGLAGHTFTQLGGDGGLNEVAVDVEQPLLVPGQRLDLSVTPQGDSGSALDLMAVPYSRGLPLRPSEPRALLRVELAAASHEEPPLPPLRAPIPMLELDTALEVPISLTVDAVDGKIRMGVSSDAIGSDGMVHAHTSTTQVLLVKNESPYAHPFHLHGFFFQALDDAGALEHPLSQRDTIDIPPFATRRLAVKYDERPGMWMFHCHILDHAEAGMMGMIHVMR